MTDTKHSPTPWVVINDGAIVLDRNGGTVGMGRNAADDAKHFVRCVNTHDDLVEVLKMLRAHLHHVGDAAYVRVADEALRKAGVK